MISNDKRLLENSKNIHFELLIKSANLTHRVVRLINTCGKGGGGEFAIEIQHGERDPSCTLV